MYLPNLVGGFQELEWGPPSILPPEMSRRMHTQHGVSSQESTLWSVGSHHRLGKTDETWWRHQMETFSASLGLCPGNEPVTGEFPSQRPVTRSFDVSFICAWTNGWVNNREAGDLRRHHTHYDVIVILQLSAIRIPCIFAKRYSFGSCQIHRVLGNCQCAHWRKW